MANKNNKAPVSEDPLWVISDRVNKSIYPVRAPSPSEVPENYDYYDSPPNQKVDTGFMVQQMPINSSIPQIAMRSGYSVFRGTCPSCLKRRAAGLEPKPQQKVEPPRPGAKRVDWRVCGGNCAGIGCGCVAVIQTRPKQFKTISDLPTCLRNTPIDDPCTCPSKERAYNAKFRCHLHDLPMPCPECMMRFNPYAYGSNIHDCDKKKRFFGYMKEEDEDTVDMTEIESTSKSNEKARIVYVRKEGECAIRKVYTPCYKPYDPDSRYKKKRNRTYQVAFESDSPTLYKLMEQVATEDLPQSLIKERKQYALALAKTNISQFAHHSKPRKLKDTSVIKNQPRRLQSLHYSACSPPKSLMPKVPKVSKQACYSLYSCEDDEEVTRLKELHETQAEKKDNIMLEIKLTETDTLGPYNENKDLKPTVRDLYLLSVEKSIYTDLSPALFRQRVLYNFQQDLFYHPGKNKSQTGVLSNKSKKLDDFLHDVFQESEEKENTDSSHRKKEEIENSHTDTSFQPEKETPWPSRKQQKIEYNTHTCGAIECVIKAPNLFPNWDLGMILTTYWEKIIHNTTNNISNQNFIKEIIRGFNEEIFKNIPDTVQRLSPAFSHVKENTNKTIYHSTLDDNCSKSDCKNIVESIRESSVHPSYKPFTVTCLQELQHSSEIHCRKTSKQQYFQGEEYQYYSLNPGLVNSRFSPSSKLNHPKMESQSDADKPFERLQPKSPQNTFLKECQEYFTKFEVNPPHEILKNKLLYSSSNGSAYLEHKPYHPEHEDESKHCIGLPQLSEILQPGTSTYSGKEYFYEFKYKPRPTENISKPFEMYESLVSSCCKLKYFDALGKSESEMKSEPSHSGKLEVPHYAGLGLKKLKSCLEEHYSVDNQSEQITTFGQLNKTLYPLTHIQQPRKSKLFSIIESTFLAGFNAEHMKHREKKSEATFQSREETTRSFEKYDSLFSYCHGLGHLKDSSGKSQVSTQSKTILFNRLECTSPTTQEEPLEVNLNMQRNRTAYLAETKPLHENQLNNFPENISKGHNDEDGSKMTWLLPY